jgi:hypothetical protein
MNLPPSIREISSYEVRCLVSSSSDLKLLESDEIIVILCPVPNTVGLNYRTCAKPTKFFDDTNSMYKLIIHSVL